MPLICIRSAQLTQNHNQIGYAWYPRRAVASFPVGRSSEVTLWCHQVAVRFLPITFDRNELETWGWCHSIRLVKAHRLIYNMTFLGHTVTLTWRDLRLNWPSKDKKHMDRCGLTRGTRWCQKYAPSFNTWEVIHEQTFPQKTYFFRLVTSRTYSIRLNANLRAQIDSGDSGLSFGHLTILLASIAIEIIAIFSENNPIMRKFYLFWPPCDLKFDLIKNDLRMFM